MGAVRIRVQTADKNITIIYTTPVHQLTSWEDKSWVFVRNKFIIKAFCNFKRLFPAKYASIIHNNAFSVAGSHFVWIRREICTDQAQFTSENSSKQICGWILMWETAGDGLVIMDGNIIMDYGLILAGSNTLKLKHLNDGFVSYKHTTLVFSRC